MGADIKTNFQTSGVCLEHQRNGTVCQKSTPFCHRCFLPSCNCKNLYSYCKSCTARSTQIITIGTASFSIKTVMLTILLLNFSFSVKFLQKNVNKLICAVKSCLNTFILLFPCEFPLKWGKRNLIKDIYIWNLNVKCFNIMILTWSNNSGIVSADFCFSKFSNVIYDSSWMYFKIFSDISQLKGACTEFFRCRAVVVFCEMSVKILQDSKICLSWCKF